MSEKEIYLKQLEAVKNGYLGTLIISASIFIGAICCAVFYNALIGLGLLMLGIIAYAALTKGLLYATLGIAYRSFHGCMTITELYGKEREVIYIPDKVIMLTVTEIGTKTFKHESSKNVREIYIPKSIMRIGSSAFAKLPSLTDLYYEGSEEEWKELSRLAPLEDVNLHFNEPMPRLERRKHSKKSKEDQVDQ